ncbi:MAG TPA: hypothetical protein VLE97_00995 [Gaiellaceae bacterium]|nr:hypothetical protein [Gaiellaceae bacterium]
MTVGVVGLGVVGGTLRDAFERREIATVGYDPYLGIGARSDLLACGIVFVCVSTPAPSSGGYDLAEVWAASETIAAHASAGTIVAIRSTVAPGTTDRLQIRFPDLRFASVPEFLVAENPAGSFQHADRIVIGTSQQDVYEALAELLMVVIHTSRVLHVMPVEAELIKVCSGALLAAKVAMANELFEVCTRYGVDWRVVQQGVGMDRRIGPSHLTVTDERGFGGACLPKDLDGLITAARLAGYEPTLLARVAGFNRSIRKAPRRANAR